MLLGVRIAGEAVGQVEWFRCQGLGNAVAVVWWRVPRSESGSVVIGQDRGGSISHIHYSYWGRLSHNI